MTSKKRIFPEMSIHYDEFVVSLIDKLASLERRIAEERGDFLFFGLLLREDAPDRWDLVVAAPWIKKDDIEALKYLSAQLTSTLTAEELVKISRIVLLREEGQVAKNLNKFHVTAPARFVNANLFGLEIKDGIIFASKAGKNQRNDKARSLGNTDSLESSVTR